MPHFLLLLFGVFCGSTAVILIKASNEHPFLVAAYRLLLAAAILSPLFFREIANSKEKFERTQLIWVLPPGIFLAVHFMSWIVGARMTQVANASLISNLTPVAMPFFLWMFFREEVKRRELIGTALTLLGLFIMTGSNFQVSQVGFLGDVICFGSMLAFAAYLALGRKNGLRINIWLYLVPLYVIAGLICLIAASFLINPIKTYSMENILYIIGLAVIPTVFGHSILNYSMKFFRGQVVSVVNLSQPVFASLLGFIIFQERPAMGFYPAAFMILLGVLVVLTAGAPSTAQLPTDLP